MTVYNRTFVLVKKRSDNFCVYDIMVGVKKMELPKRKPLRLPNFDYGTSGAYFITICTKDKKALFGPVGADIESAPTISDIVRSFKRYSTVEYIKMVRGGVVPPFDKQLW